MIVNPRFVFLLCLIMLFSSFAYPAPVTSPAYAAFGKSVSLNLAFNLLPWYDSAWAYRKNITFNSSQIAENSLANFPVLINISDTDMANNAQADGDDILFTSGDGTTKLDHEIENYTAGNLVAWVRIPTLLNTTNQTIFMYYGNSASGNQQNRTGVWNSSYVGVWHLGEGAGIRANDSTRNNNNGTTSGGPTWNTTGQADGSMNFDGVNDYVSASTVSGLTAGNTIHSIAAWVKVNSLPSNRAWILLLGNEGTGSHHWLINSAGATQFGVWNGGQTQPSLPVGQWRHVVITFDGTTLRSYVNGEFSQSAAATFNLQGIPLTLAQVHISENYFSGVLDEVRISNGTFSSGWIKTEYNNQFSPSAFASIGTTSDAFSNSNDYVAVASPNVVLGIVSPSAFGTRYDVNYSADNYIVEARNPLGDARFFLVFTQGSSATITGKIEAVKLHGIVGKTFGDFYKVAPDMADIFLRAEYTDVNILGRIFVGAGSRKIGIRNEGVDDKGVTNISLEVVK